MDFIRPHWNAPPNVKALTSTRLDGVSYAPYQSLNLGDHVGDEKSLVEQNRQSLCSAIKTEFQFEANYVFQPQWLRQEHTINIVEDHTLQAKDTAAYDGQFTQTKNVVCTIMTADCMPVFICNQQGTEVALVHAGWRGLADGIVEKAISLFTAPVDQLLVHCGPAISQQHFEVGDEVKQQLGGSQENYRPNLNKKGHSYANLYGLLAERMQALGVTYSHANHCTFDEAERFFSYRRDGVTGRMVSLLWME